MRVMIFYLRKTIRESYFKQNDGNLIFNTSIILIPSGLCGFWERHYCVTNWGLSLVVGAIENYLSAFEVNLTVSSFFISC